MWEVLRWRGSSLALLLDITQIESRQRRGLTTAVRHRIEGIMEGIVEGMFMEGTVEGMFMEGTVEGIMEGTSEMSAGGDGGCGCSICRRARRRRVRTTSYIAETTC